MSLEMKECKCGMPMANYFRHEETLNGVCMLCFDELPITEQRKYFDVTSNPNPDWDKHLEKVAKRLGWNENKEKKG